MIRFLKHWIKAKGRHGTHSPFVYQFVEQVLRNYAANKLPAAFQLLIEQESLPISVFKAIKYVNPSVVTIYDPNKYEHWHKVLPTIFPKVQLKKFDTLLSPVNSSQISFYYFETLKNFKLSDWHNLIRHTDNQSYIYINNNNIDNESTKVFEELISESEITLSLDCYYFGVIIKDDSFKNKQHFLLK